MIYQVKIDKKSIKENPWAGQDHFQVVTGPPNIEYKDGNVVSITQPYQTYYTLGPQPKFTYNYLPTLVKCCFCNEEFDYTKLEVEDYGDDYGWSETVCPKCHCVNCCEIEFETLV